MTVACYSMAEWIKQYPLENYEVDCAITVMLKILDGKCKMKEQEKIVMTALYDEIKVTPSELFSADIHKLIESSRAMVDTETDEAMDAEWKDAIYEMRVLAETKISRPVMKAFKAAIRQKDIFLYIGDNHD